LDREEASGDTFSLDRWSYEDANVGAHEKCI